MAYQPYGNYTTPVQAPIPQYQYAAGYTIADYNAYYGIPPPEPEPPAPQQPPPAAVQIQNIDATVASQCMRRFISTELRNAGFKTYESAALDRLEKEVDAFVEVLHRHAKEYANLANRVLPTPFDVLAVCEDRGISMSELRRASGKKRRKRVSVSPTRLVTPPLREPSPELLPSDDEDTPLPPAQAAALPQTLQDLPEHLPSLPPKHTYLHTAPATLKKAKVPSLDKKLDTASKVQQSLRNLVKATEDTTGRGDLELANGVVNWMATSNTGKKRWKLR
ncbi:hypothetical protein M422DRAFT_24333 [Sphaerobolus stellatus SS14]|nr:hypothetical protein M422DRAFT_24333 [Sphaerobolus stellatus SS14]